MSNLLEKTLDSEGVFEGNIPDIVEYLASSIPSTTIPYRMKLAIAFSEATRYASQFRKNILLWNNSSIPINAITFCIAKSGASKDSSVNACRKCFDTSFKLIQNVREDYAKKLAIKKAKDSGEEDYNSFSVYKEFLQPIPPFIIGVSTVEGLLQNIALHQENIVGSCYLYSGELGAELISNANIVDNVKSISELFDEGNKEVKALKDYSNQTEVKNVSVNAMFMGSQDNLLFDEVVKRKFKNEFTTKLGRRSFFIFVNEELPKDNFKSIEELIEIGRLRDDNAQKYREKASELLNDITEYWLNNEISHIKVSSEVRNLYIVYTQYNSDLADKIDLQFPIAKLHRTHMQWKALKIAGTIAMLDKSSSIELKHYKAAIEYTELVSYDIANFEKELVKEPYETFVSFMKTNAIDGNSLASLHTLRKMGFIPTKGIVKNKLLELVQLATSYDKNGTYFITDDNEIKYSSLYKTDEVGVSYVSVPSNKENRHTKSSTGYRYDKTTFKELYKILITDVAFCPFEFTNGVRSNDNILGKTKWLALDIDNSLITDEECHNQLEDINHHICRTSDSNNPYKFRLLVELDAPIDVPISCWRQFLQEINAELGINSDLLAKSQIFYGYSSSKDTLFSNIDASPLYVKPILDLVLSNVKENKDYVDVPKTKNKQLLDNPQETFRLAYNAKQGEGSRRLICAAYYAKKLGASKEYIINLMNDINNSWLVPMNNTRFENTVINQINRWVI